MDVDGEDEVQVGRVGQQEIVSHLKNNLRGV